MNNCIFTDNEKNHYKRIDKRQARRAYNDGKTVILCPCNLRPFGFWQPEIYINKNDFKKYGYIEPFIFSDGTTEMDFNRRLNQFEFYNCINSETGKYTAFYIQINNNKEV